MSQLNKRIKMIQGYVQTAQEFSDALNQFLELNEDYTNSQIIFDDQTDFNGGDVMHMDANSMVVLINSIAALKAQMNASGWTAAIEKAKP